MSKIKKLTWFAFFCTVTQYIRERRVLSYLLGTAFNCIIPGVLFLFYFNGHIGWLSFIGINAIFRLLLAPLDEYISEEFSYMKLCCFPLHLGEKLYVRIVSKSMQLSEWIFVALMSWVCISSHPIKDAIFLIISITVCIELVEEIVFYIVYLTKNIKYNMFFYITICIGVIGAIIYFRQSQFFGSFEVILGASLLTVIGIIAIVILCKTADKHRVVTKIFKKKKPYIPISSQITKKVITKSCFTRLLCNELIYMFKIKPWNLVSALAYCVAFSALDRSDSYLYILIQYFIVDFFFLSGFNYYGNIDDADGLVLMSTVDKKDLIRSKNDALGSTALFFSAILTLILSVIYGNSVKEITLTMFANVFCISVMMLCSSVISIKYFHLNDSKKKYTISNVICMIITLITCSMISALIFVGSSFAAIGLIFMIMMSCVCLFFSLLDVSILERLFNNALPKMIATMRDR